MVDNERPDDLQEAVERSYRARWGGRRFYLVTAIVLFALAIISAILLSVAREWFGLAADTLKIVEICILAVGFVCLIVAVLAALEALVRWQREQGQFPNKAIHAALSLSMVTVAGLVFLLVIPWQGSAMGASLVRIIRFVVILFAGMAWLGSVVMNSAGVTMLVTRRSELLEVNSTTEGTALLFRKGHSAELVKLAVAALVPFIIFVIALVIAGAYLVS